MTSCDRSSDRRRGLSYPVGMACHRIIALFAVIMASLALGVAFSLEWWAHRPPCALCLVERWPYRIAIALGVIALFLPPRPALVLCGLAALSFCVAAGAGLLHAGVEWHFWPSPLPECAAPRFSSQLSITDMLAHMPTRPDKPCDEPTYLIPGFPVSMAFANCLYALAMAIIMMKMLLALKPDRA
ncbi:disulfide bond formation protein B [Granulibacter bethesdensis]|uniref:disulfide bond formation protein B n=2 Tax=Granulibacter bethesdensis TaxID=364410 RepID=UPI000BA3FC0B|nr:disulfide bond formation protein B [Granulibacter bethesdensis]